MNIPIIFENTNLRKIKLTIELFNIPQIENGFNLSIQNKTLQTGLICDSYTMKSMKLKKFNDLRSKLNSGILENKKGIMSKNEVWYGITKKNIIYI